MDDALLVRLFESRRDLHAQPADLFLGQFPRLEHIGKRGPGYKFHRQKIDLLLCVKVEDGGDIGVIELGQGLGFLAEPFPGRLVRQGMSGKNFDGHVAAEMFIAGEIDLAHPACADPFDETVMAESFPDHGEIP